MLFHDGPRTWKFAVPAAVFILLIPITGKMIISADVNIQYWSMVPCGFAGLCLAIAALNIWKLITSHNEELFSEHQSALSITPVVLLAQNMRQMHPEAVRVLERFGVRTGWQVRVDVARGTRTHVLEGTEPNVHFGFIEFVLSHSGKALYPRNRFKEGSKKWDPDGIVEDREQHKEFEKWLFSRLMVTRSHGEFKPAEFLPPWTPPLVMDVMGISMESVELYQPEDDLDVKQLPAEKEAKPVQKAEAREQDKVRELTDEELDAIQNEMVRNASQYSQ